MMGFPWHFAKSVSCICAQAEEFDKTQKEQHQIQSCG